MGEPLRVPVGCAIVFRVPAAGEAGQVVSRGDMRRGAMMAAPCASQDCWLASGAGISEYSKLDN